MADASKKLFKRTATPMHPFTNPIQPHKDGFFRYSRHPMYPGIAIVLFGLAVLSGHVFNMGFAILYVVLCDLFYVRAEEEKLELKFGDQFTVYKRETRRWV